MVGQDRSTEKRLEAAELRLAEAIVRLETALENRAPSNPGTAPDVVAELQRLQAENGDLKGLIGQSSLRLEASIGKLKDQMVSQTEGQN